MYRGKTGRQEDKHIGRLICITISLYGLYNKYNLNIHHLKCHYERIYKDENI